MRVAVVGLGKSGSTALLYAIRAAMPADTQVIFEPHAHVTLQTPNVAAKVLLHPRYPIEHAFYRQFDRLVLLVRDPRDLLVSRALYRVFGARALHADRGKLDRYIALLRVKEADPQSISLTRINAVFESLAGPTLHSDEGLTRLLNDAVEFHHAFRDCMVFKYEMMVAGCFESVAAYLSLQAQAMKPEVPATLSRVVRTRRAGNWRDWFCPDDIAHYRPLLSAYMERYGYPDDWELNARPEIRREECSEYGLRLVRERLGVSLPLNR
jgi:hypothetical protein